MDHSPEELEIVKKYFISKGIETKDLETNPPLKNPDFELKSDGSIVGYCELKTISREEAFRGIKPDPAYNNIERKISEAYNQLNTINTKHEVMNIIFLLNKEPSRDFNDLKLILPRNQASNNNSIFSVFRNRVIRKTNLDLIDLIIWYQYNTSDITIFSSEKTPFKNLIQAKNLITSFNK